MRYLLIGLGILVGLIVLGFIALVINLKLATARHRKRIAQKLEPVIRPIQSGAAPDPALVHQLAANAETRNHLYEAMETAGNQQLFPAQFRTPQMLAKSDMATWVAHPNELKSAPDEIQLVKIVTLP